MITPLENAVRAPIKGGIMWKLITLALAVGAFAAPALAANQINVKDRDAGTFSLARTETPGILEALAARGGHGAQTIVAKVREVTFVYPPTAICPAETLFEADIPLLSRSGDQLGTGASCVQGWPVGPCPDPPPPGCRQTTLAIFVLSFPEGTITADVTIDELWIASGGGVVEHGAGTITDGTRIYAGATGTIDYSGILRFNGLVRFTFLIRIN
jgi:hypothetical protein